MIPGSLFLLDEIDFSNGTDWKHLNQISIGDLFVKSTPKYEIPACTLQGVDCSKNWTLVQTFTGYWLVFKRFYTGKLIRFQLKLFKQ